jgi:hypothetical protein
LAKKIATPLFLQSCLQSMVHAFILKAASTASAGLNLNLLRQMVSSGEELITFSSRAVIAATAGPGIAERT